MARYDRYLKNFEAAKGAGYVPYVVELLEEIKQLQPECHHPEYAFDIHLREKGQVMVYHGGTCLLSIDLSCLHNGEIRFTSKSYGIEGEKQRSKGCAEAFAALKGPHSIKEVETIKTMVRRFLVESVATVSARYYFDKRANKYSEGYWSSRLSIDYGRYWRPSDAWLIIDREAVIGFDTTGQKNDYYRQIKQDVMKIMQDSEFSGWDSRSKGFGDELDFLAIGPDRQLLCIELKHGCNASGIYWGPLQTTVYLDAYAGKIDQFGKDIATMVRQKIELGLLPPEAQERIPAGGFTKVGGVLAVADADLYLNSESWQRAGMVNDKLACPVTMMRSISTERGLEWEPFPRQG